MCVICNLRRATFPVMIRGHRIDACGVCGPKAISDPGIIVPARHYRREVSTAPMPSWAKPKKAKPLHPRGSRPLAGDYTLNVAHPKG